MMRREDDDDGGEMDDEFDFELGNDDDMDPDMDMGSDDDFDTDDDSDYNDDGETDDHEEDHGDTESRLNDLEDKVTDILTKLTQVIAQTAVDDMGDEDDMEPDTDMGDDDLDMDIGDDDDIDAEEKLEAGYTIDDGPEGNEYDDGDDEEPLPPINRELRKRIEDRRREKEMRAEFGLDELSDTPTRRRKPKIRKHRITEKHLKAALQYGQKYPECSFNEMTDQLFKG
jgi:hypothetical protein